MTQTLDERKAARRESCRKYRETHHEQYLETKRKYRELHRKRSRELAHRWYKEHPERAKASKLKRKFGITLEDYERFLAEQGGVCIICGGNRGKQALDVDHNHITGKVCGLLCRKCNLGLGWFADNPEWLRKAAEYRDKLGGQHD